MIFFSIFHVMLKGRRLGTGLKRKKMRRNHSKGSCNLKKVMYTFSPLLYGAPCFNTDGCATQRRKNLCAILFWCDEGYFYVQRIAKFLKALNFGRRIQSTS